MKILFLTTDVFSLSSGIAQVSRMACKALSESELVARLDVISLVDPLNTLPNPRYLAPKKSSYKSAGGDKIRFLSQIASNIGNGYDVCITSHINLTPILFTLQRLFPQLSTVSFAHGIEVWCRMTWLRRLSAKNLSAIWAVSKFTQSTMSRANGIPLAKISVLYNCLDPVKDICQLNGNNNSVDIKHPALLTVSRISEVDAYKGHETVIRAIAKVRQQIPGVHYYVAGRGDLLPSLKNLARDLKVEEAVHFLGYVDDSVLSAIYSQCDVFVMPSKKEGFGLVFAEAMAHGKPCIAGNQDASPEVVRHNQTGLIVEPRNVDQIADAILTLISDDELRNKFGAKGKQLVTEEFSFDAFQGQMIEYLKPLYPTKIR